MAGKRPSVLERFREWLGASIANRLTFAAVALTMSVVGVIGLAAFIISYLQIERSVRDELTSEVNMFETRLDGTLGALQKDLDSLSANTLVSTGLLDSQGREAYLIPFLRDYRSSLGMPVALSLHDFQGGAIAGNNPGGLSSFQGAPWVVGVMTQARPHAEIISRSDGNYLLLAYPVLYPSTDKAEGMLVAELNLTRLFQHASGQGNSRFTRHLLDGQGRHVGEHHEVDHTAKTFVVRKSLQLASPLAALGLQVEASALRKEVMAPLNWMAIIYLTVGCLTLFFVLWVTRKGVRRLTQSLVELSEVTEGIAASNLSGVKVPVAGRDETARLAQNFNRMIDGLNDSYQTLERRIAERTRELEELNETLEKRVRAEAAKNREKDLLLIQQSRLAAMGEMIGNIAHQWRQPLNAISLLFANIKDAYDFKELTEAYLDESTRHGMRLTQQMSTTIDDFRNFFRPNRAAEPFSLAQAVHSALELVEASFNNHEIAITLNITGDARMQGFANEYSQVLLNILGNARDAIVENKVKPGRVNIEVGHDQMSGYVVVRDNGGGIAEGVLGKIFDPYFTTREKGTGIGLYMSKMIIENNMRGRIEVRNLENGAEFRVVTPLAPESVPQGQ